MTIPEEIEQLKIQLEQTADEREQAELLLEILNKYSFINYAGSQTSIDLLLQISEKLNEPIYQAWGLHYLATLKRAKAEYDVALQLSQQALSLFENLKKKLGIALCYNNIGIAYYKQGNYTDALKNHLTSLKIKEEVGDKMSIAFSYNNIGNIYYEKGNYLEALENHFTALKIRKEIGHKQGIADSYNCIGNIFCLQGNYPDALKNHFDSLRIREEIGDKMGIASSYNNIGCIYNLQGNYLEALENYFSSLKIEEKIGNKNDIAGSYNNIGSVYYEQRNYAEALKYYFTVLGITTEIGNKKGIARSYINISNVYEKQNNYAEALKEALRALEISEEIGNKELIKESFLYLAHVYKATNDFENALTYYEKYHAVEKEMLGEESTKQLNNLSFMHNLEQKEKDLEIEQLRNVELKNERDRSESLLLNILPAEVAEELKDTGAAAAKHFNDVTVLFTDFKGFSTVSERLTPQQLVDELHACFSAFDDIMGKYNIEKIKTVGDAYLAVSGLPMENVNHAEDIVKAAREIKSFMLNRRTELGEKTFEVRIGIHSGSVVAGIVGVKKFAYDIWGDTVNTAARMEQNSEAGKINISQTTYELVQDKFTCEYRGEVEAKNKGMLKMYFVN